MNKWTEFAIRIQSLAQAGLAYCKNEYDIERYEELRKIAAEMIACETNLPIEKVQAFFCNVLHCFPPGQKSGRPWKADCLSGLRYP